MLQKLVKYAIVVPHGIDPLNRVRIVPQRPGPSGINAMPIVQQNLSRTAVGLARLSTPPFEKTDAVKTWMPGTSPGTM
jgi:hypothetical protein